MGPLQLETTTLFSKWVEAFPVKSTDTETLATLLINEVICRFGVPHYIHSDQGANLTSNLMAVICERLGTHQCLLPPREWSSGTIQSHFRIDASHGSQ